MESVFLNSSVNSGLVSLLAISFPNTSTVSKYIDKNFKPIDETKIKRIGVNDVPEFTTALFEGVEDLGDLCVLSDDERVEIVDLWEEIAV